jgi:hypothetical protein
MKRVNRITILTSSDYFNRLSIPGHSPEMARLFERYSDFIILGEESSRPRLQLGTDSSNRIKTRYNNKIHYCNNLTELLKNGFIKSGNEIIMPEAFIGLDTHSYEQVLASRRDWINLSHPEKNKFEVKHVTTNIYIYQWLQKVINTKDKIKSITIEDPYFFSVFSDKSKKQNLLNIFEKLSEDKQLSTVTIKFEKSETKIAQSVIDKYKEEVLDKLGFEPDYYFDEAFHDRMIIIDGLIFLVGHSFSMPKDYTTYVIGMDKFTYLVNSAE